MVEEEVAQEQRGENNRGLEVKHGSMWLMVDGWSLLERALEVVGCFGGVFTGNG